MTTHALTEHIPTPTVPAPDILRCAYMELVVTDLSASREFYVDLLGLAVTAEDGRLDVLHGRAGLPRDAPALRATTSPGCR